MMDILNPKSPLFIDKSKQTPVTIARSLHKDRKKSDNNQEANNNQKSSS